MGIPADQQHQCPSEAGGMVVLVSTLLELAQLFLSQDRDAGQSSRRREAVRNPELLSDLPAFLLPPTGLKRYCFMYPFGMNAFSLTTAHFCSAVTCTQQWKHALP